MKKEYWLYIAIASIAVVAYIAWRKKNATVTPTGSTTKKTNLTVDQ